MSDQRGSNSFLKEHFHPPWIIVHFMRHAEGVHKEAQKTAAQRANSKMILDPDLSKRGEGQAGNFALTPNNCGPYLTHVLFSPMARAISTSCRAFYSVHLGLRDDVIALPELQNMDTSPNGTGSGIEILQARLAEKFSLGDGFVKVVVDVWTFVSKDWNMKTTGKWSPEEVKWRIGFLKGFLKGIWLGGGRQKVEIAVVTHGSFLQQLNVESKEADVTTCMFDGEGDFRTIDYDELQSLRQKWKR